MTRPAPTVTQPSRNGSRTSARAAALGLVLALLCVAPPARADCYDILGCSDRDLFSKRFDYLIAGRDGPNCDFLQGMREAILAENGDPNAFSGRADSGRLPAGLRLSRIERTNMATIRRAEAAKHCRR